MSITIDLSSVLLIFDIFGFWSFPWSLASMSSLDLRSHIRSRNGGMPHWWSSVLHLLECPALSDFYCANAGSASLPLTFLTFDMYGLYGQQNQRLFMKFNESSMKTAESGSLLDILACPAFNPILGQMNQRCSKMFKASMIFHVMPSRNSIWWDRIIGLCLMPTDPQYSLACIFTWRGSATAEQVCSFHLWSNRLPARDKVW